MIDRPPNEFRPISLLEKHEFLLKLSDKYDVFRSSKENSTILTEYISNQLHLCPDRPGFIVSSTSWTEDEDFSILLNALQGIPLYYCIRETYSMFLHYMASILLRTFIIISVFYRI